MMSGITWYDVLGVLPDATPEDIHAAWQAEKGRAAAGRAGGGFAECVVAAARARQVVEGAWGVLGDPVVRERYDEEIGFARRGGARWRPGGGRWGRMSAWATGGPRRMRNHWSRIRIRMAGWSCRMSRGCSTACAWRCRPTRPARPRSGYATRCRLTVSSSARRQSPVSGYTATAG